MFKANFKRKSQRGFTLIELLIVIAILGILAAVAIPNVTDFIVTAKAGAANAEYASVQTASVVYYADKGVYPADSSSLSSYMSGAGIKLTGGYDISANGEVTPATMTGSGDLKVVTFDGSTIHWDTVNKKFVK